jgi:type II secretory pathway pseudopilin PulG
MLKFFTKNNNSLKPRKTKVSLRDESGFTIMETLVAIFILLLSITGPMAFSQSALRAAFQSRDQITAFYLAQDAIEFVKNRRDHNILAGNDWLAGLGNCDEPGINKGCTINTTINDGAIERCNPSGKPGCLGDNSNGLEDKPLKIYEEGESYEGYFNSESNGGDDSTFARTIYIDEFSNGYEAEVVVKIRWTSHDTIGVREITVVEHIYNWAGVLLGS